MEGDAGAGMPGLGDDPPSVSSCSRKRRLGAEDHMSVRRKIGELAMAGAFESQDLQATQQASTGFGYGVPKGGSKIRPRLDWASHVYGLTDREFKARYRMSPRSFNILFEKLRPSIESAPIERHGILPLPAENRLAMTLR